MRPDHSQNKPVSASSGLARLASELVGLARDAPEQLKSRVAELSVREQAELALRLPAGQRLELLLHAPKPMRLVRAIPDSELYMTLREVGPEDGMPLLALSSAAQILHMMDLESWRRDRFDVDRAGAWIAVLVDAGEPTLRRFVLSADDEILSMLVAGWMRIQPIETGEDEDIHGTGEGDARTEKGYLTPDGFHRFDPKLEAHAPAIRRVLQMLFVSQPQRYQRVIWGARWELPSDIEESAYLWRQSRLEEHGFPPWEQAMEVFNPPESQKQRPIPMEPLTEDGLAASRSPLRLRSQQGSLAPAIDNLDDVLRERVLHEVLSVANRVLIATRADAGDPRQHQRALETAAGYITIALEQQGALDPAAKTRLLEEVPALELFRQGYARAEELQRRAAVLKRSGWASAHPRALELLDSPVRERVLALLEPRPLYVVLAAEDGKDVLREPRSSDELAECLVALEVAELAGKVLVETAGLDVHDVCLQAGGESLPRLSRYFLTLLAWRSSRNELRGDPLPADVATDFLRNVASRRTASPDAPARALEALVASLSDTGTLSARELSIFQAFGRYCLNRLAQECAGVDPGVPLSQADVTCLVLA
jgi:hypothetical protein